MRKPFSIVSEVSTLVKEAGIKKSTWETFEKTLNNIKKHHRSTYFHCLRVGYYSYGIAKKEKWKDAKFPLFGGCGHDYGKCAVSTLLLDSKGLTKKEFEKIKKHTTVGFARLKGTFLFTSFIAVLHHKYKEKGYGIDLEESAPKFLKAAHKEKIKDTAELVMIADFFDALTTRNNDKGLIKNTLDTKEIRKVMKQFFPKSIARINWLIKHKISVA